MDEPVIVQYGREFIGEYQPDEFEASLRRAFVDRRADFIALDSNPHGQKFLAAGVAWAMDQGWLCTSQSDDIGQGTVWTFRLTDAGRSYFEVRA